MKKGISYIELLISLSIVSIFMVVIFNLFFQMSTDYRYIKNTTKQTSNLLRVQQQIERDFLENNVAQVNGTDDLTLTLKDGRLITFKNDEQNIEYKNQLTDKITYFYDASIAFDATSSRVTVASKDKVLTFTLFK